MRIKDAAIDKMIVRAKKLCGIPEWEVTWDWGTPEFMAENDPTWWTEHRAYITLGKKDCASLDRNAMFRLIVHELLHVVVAPIWKSASDWIYELVKDETQRAIFDRAQNTSENTVIDFIISKIMRLG
jgi:hypothetical protein